MQKLFSLIGTFNTLDSLHWFLSCALVTQNWLSYVWAQSCLSGSLIHTLGPLQYYPPLCLDFYHLPAMMTFVQHLPCLCLLCPSSHSRSIFRLTILCVWYQYNWRLLHTQGRDHVSYCCHSESKRTQPAAASEPALSKFP